MSGDLPCEERSILENNLKSQLLKGCCQVFHRQNGREIAVLGCLAVTIKSQSTNVSPLVYFVHINQILTEQDYKSSVERTTNAVRGEDNNSSSSNKTSAIKRDIKTEPENSLFSALPAEMIPPGKGFVMKTQTVYEKTADGEERKVSVSTQGLIDTCDMKAFAGQSQESSGFKQEPQDCHYQPDAYYDGCYVQGAYADGSVMAGDYNQAYPTDSAEYYEEEYEDPLPPPPPRKPKIPKSRTGPVRNQTRKKVPAGSKNRFSAQSTLPNRQGGAEHFDYDSQQRHNLHQQQQQRPAKANSGRSFGSKLGRATHDPANPYVVTRSMHECGYPGCGKRFKWKQHLLRHQTEKHGRVPSKKLAFEKVLVRNPHYQRQAADGYCNTIGGNSGDGYYEGVEEDDYGCAESQDYYYE